MAKKSDPKQQSPPPSHEEVAEYAYRLFEQEGKQPGHELDHWLRAESELNVQRKDAPRAAAKGL